MNSFLKDVTHSLRMFSRSPKFTFAAIAALALGIGANAAIFSVVNSVLLQPIHAPDPDRVVAFSVDPASGRAFASDIKFNLWREQTSVFEQQSAYRTSTLDLTGLDQPQKVNAIHVTGDYFRLFGLPLAQGRSFSAEEERPNGPPVVLVSTDFWRNSLGGSPAILGKTLLLGGEPHQVIGVLASSVRTDMIKQPDVWLPFPIDPNSTAQVHYFLAAGRLKPGITLAMANAQLQITTREFWRRYPDTVSTRRGDILFVQPLQDVLVKNIRSSLLTLWAAVGLVLLIACANVASLLLVRATARQREIAIRIALGASPARIVRQLLTESVLLATAGALLGLAFGVAGIRALLSLNAVILPRLGVDGANVPVDAHVVLLTMITALVTGLLFGLVPALQASRVDVNSHLKESAGRTGTGFHQTKMRSLLVISELSLSLLLLIGAALLIRTLVSLRSVNPGFDSQNIVAAEVSLDPKLAKTASKDEIIQDVLRRLSNTPGVDRAALTNLLPLNGDFNSLPLIVVGRPLTGAAHGFGRWMIVSPDYFDVLKIPLISGRAFVISDRRGAPGVAVINQSMARQFWPSKSPIGEQLLIAKGLGPNLEDTPRQIIGVVGDVHDDTLQQNATPAFYIPAEQRPGPPALSTSMWAVVRTRTPSPTLNTAIQNELRQASGGLAIAPLVSMEETVVKSTARQSFNMILMLTFGLLSLLLAAIGIYGLMAYSVQQRTQEIGIRLALGAERSTVRNMIVRHGIHLIAVGIAIGLVVAFIFSRVMETFLFGVHAHDPLVFLLAPIVLASVALIAVFLPARRASRVDPMQALRYE